MAPGPHAVTRVVIVDDSATMRRLLSELLSADPHLEVVGTARDPYEARRVIKETNPDVLTLDVEMPRMNGVAFLEKIMTLRPMPVVMVSTLTREGADVTIRALEIGAVDIVTKPDSPNWEALGQELIAKVKLAARARIRYAPARPSTPAPVPVPRRATGTRLIAIGASTGGVERIREILSVMPADAPPIVITQHMGATYLESFANRLNALSAMSIALAQEGQRLRPGHVLIAPGDRHLAIVRDGASGYACRLDAGGLVTGHRPSVDVLFRSVAEAAGRQAVGAILSGMGKDGAQGLLAMRQAGAFTIGERESSCVVYGMPRAAKELGAVAVELPLAEIPAALLAGPLGSEARASSP